MSGGVFLPIFAMIFVVTWLLIWAARLSPLKFSVPSYLLLMLFIFQYAGLALYFFELDHRSADPMVTPEATVRLLSYTSTGVILLCVGFVAMSAVKGVALRQRDVLCQPFLVTRLESFWLTALASVCVLVLLLYLSQIERVAILAAVEGTQTEAHLARSDMGNNFAGRYHWYSFFMRDLLLIATVALFVVALVKKRLLPKLLYLVFLAAMVFSAVMATEKGPIVDVIIAHFIAYIYVKKNSAYLSMATCLVAVAGLVALSIAYMGFMGAADVETSLARILSRTLTGQIQPFYWLIEFMQEREFFYGRTFPNPGGLMPFENVRLTVELMDWVRPEMQDRGIVGSAPTVFIGEAYANFGIWGIVILPFVLGCWVYVVYSLIARLTDEPLKVGLLAWVALHFGKLSGTGFSGYVIDIRLVFISGVVVLVLWLSRRLKFKERPAPAIVAVPPTPAPIQPLPRGTA